MRSTRTSLRSLGLTYNPAYMVPCSLRSRSDLAGPSGETRTSSSSADVGVIPIEETELRYALLAASWGLEG